MTRNGTAYQLPPSAPITDATGSGLWPTPVAQDDGKTPEAHLAMKARMKDGPRKTITSLAVMVKAVERGLWPTPSVKGNYNRAGASVKSGDGLATAVARKTPGVLNPAWVEWLMGFPLGWTDCADSGMRSSRRSRSTSGGESLTVRP
jgi:hypothetical protein